MLVEDGVIKNIYVAKKKIRKLNSDRKPYKINLDIYLITITVVCLCIGILFYKEGQVATVQTNNNIVMSGELFERYKEKILSLFIENMDKGVTLYIENFVNTPDGVKLRHNSITIENDNLVTLKVVRKTLTTLSIPYLESKVVSGYLEVHDPSGDTIYRKKI